MGVRTELPTKEDDVRSPPRRSTTIGVPMTVDRGTAFRHARSNAVSISPDRVCTTV